MVTSINMPLVQLNSEKGNRYNFVVVMNKRKLECHGVYINSFISENVVNYSIIYG